MTPASREERYAELIVRVGANVRPGQLVDVLAGPEHAEMVRAVAREAYRAGARYVDVRYVDPHVKRALIESNAPDDVLSWTPPWLLSRERNLGDEHAAVIALTGDAEPELLADLPGGRVGKARMVDLAKESSRQVSERLCNWCVAGVPNDGWARQMFGTPDVDRLWALVEHCVRLDEADPVAAWQAHTRKLAHRAQILDELAIDALHFHGPGTDLSVGLLPESRWLGVESETIDGILYVANMPTEEVFTTPDARRTEGLVTSTMPLVVDGTIVKGLRVRFAGGRIVEVEADEGAEVIRGQLAVDENAAALGEVALVDEGSRIGATGLTFFDTLFDENAACHVAYGDAYAEAVDGGRIEGVNVSSVHTDFMIGGAEVAVDAVTRDGRTVPLLRDNVWQPED
ncbi:MAG TPA: aminopeptidase [Gaiellaceae bacterium]